jgi:hypothetical protein
MPHCGVGEEGGAASNGERLKIFEGRTAFYSHTLAHDTSHSNPHTSHTPRRGYWNRSSFSSSPVCAAGNCTTHQTSCCSPARPACRAPCACSPVGALWLTHGPTLLFSPGSPCSPAGNGRVLVDSMAPPIVPSNVPLGQRSPQVMAPLCTMSVGGSCEPLVQLGSMLPANYSGLEARLQAMRTATPAWRNPRCPRSFGTLPFLAAQHPPLFIAGGVQRAAHSWLEVVLPVA